MVDLKTEARGEFLFVTRNGLLAVQMDDDYIKFFDPHELEVCW